MKWPIPKIGEVWTRRSNATPATVVAIGPRRHVRHMQKIEWLARGLKRTSNVADFLKFHAPPETATLTRQDAPQTGDVWETDAGARISIIDGGDQSTSARRRIVTFFVEVGRTSQRTGETCTSNAANLSRHWHRVTAPPPAAC